MLLTLEDSERRRRYLNARATLETLVALGAIPVINENDTVATAEIRYGDNDRLAARVAQMASADCLVLLSDVQGLSPPIPNKDANAQLVERRAARLTPADRSDGRSRDLGMGSGGMATKIAAAKIAVAAGCTMCIAAGHPRHPVQADRGGGSLHLVRANGDPGRGTQAMDRGHACGPRARLPSMRGRLKALLDGKSLLPRRRRAHAWTL